jgi:hypothetical protein
MSYLLYNKTPEAVSNKYDRTISLKAINVNDPHRRLAQKYLDSISLDVQIVQQRHRVIH